jgi:hypothetical protein
MGACLRQPPRKVLVLNRMKDRVLLNEDEVVQMIEDLGTGGGIKFSSHH